MTNATKIITTLLIFLAGLTSQVLARAESFPDGFLTFVVAIYTPQKGAFLDAVREDQRFKDSNCAWQDVPVTGQARRKFIPAPYQVGQTVGHMRTRYSVFVIECSTEVTEEIFALLGKVSLDLTQQQSNYPIKITANIATSGPGPTGCYPRNCNGTMQKTYVPCGPLC